MLHKLTEKSRIGFGIRLPGPIFFIVVALLIVHATLCLRCALSFSPTTDEPAHLVAGYAHWKYANFEIYRVNPPLQRLIATFPLLFLDLHEDWLKLDSSPLSRCEFEVGADFLSANKENHRTIVVLARIFSIPFSLAGLLICFAWSRELYGNQGALLSATLWCFSPNIIAHGSLVTPDIAATTLILAACYAFWRWNCLKTNPRALVSGVTLGLALVSKLTAIVLPLCFVLILLVSSVFYKNNKKEQEKHPGRYKFAGQALSQLFLAWFIVNSFYGWKDSLTRLDEFDFVSKTLSYEEDKALTGNDGLPAPKNALVGSYYGKLPIPLPRDYISGIDIQRRDLESFHWPGYLRGEFSSSGWWYYYLYGLLVKIPTGTQVLFWISLALLIRTMSTQSFINGLPLLLPPLVILAVASSQTGLNHHVRYVFPVLPFAYIACGRICLAKFQGAKGIASILATSTMITCLTSSPHHLGYFNEFIPAQERGFHLLASNLDWGQDLYLLKEWQQKNPDASPLELVYHGPINPKMAGIEYVATESQSTKQGAGRTRWIAISVNYLRGFPLHVSTHQYAEAQQKYEGLLDKEPFAVIGNSIYVYRINSK